MRNKVTNFVLKILQKKQNSLYRTNEGGRIIRSLRIRKFKKRGKGLLTATKIVAIWYLLILTGSYMTNDTGAYFNDVKVINNSFQAGKWDDTVPPDNDEWDKSSLSFDGTKAWAGECNVFTTIKNTGNSANTISTWRFYLYKVTGGEKPTSGHVATGVVPKLKSGEVGQISATVKENGIYRFAVRRPLGHPGKNSPDENGYSYIWSENLINVVSCTKTEPNVSEEKSEHHPESTTPTGNEGQSENSEESTPTQKEDSPTLNEVTKD
ncbi:amyloid fiber anchoring/assembly protein TapA [Bacillus sp. FJAT-29953]|nr:amyloid fiber anchoring/assembly protein TapA [Bacillus sp. FJAT-29953]